MKIYFNDEGLIETREHYLQEGCASYSLFATRSNVYPFIKFEEEIEALNDYCVFMIRQLKSKILEIAEDSECEIEFVSCKEAARESFISLYENDDYPIALLTWETLASDINKCTMLLLWLSYLESSLDEIARWFCDVKDISFGYQKRGVTAVGHCLDKIGMCCGCNLTEELSEEIIYYNMIRKIRNRFIHREWEQISDREQQFSMSRVIDLVATMIYVVEQKACQVGVISA